jgi:uncharacterized protein YrrD
MSAELARYSDLINQLVLDRLTMEELGRIEVLWEYPQAHRVFGFIVKNKAFGKERSAFNLDHMESRGENGVMVNGDPSETDVDRVREIQSLVGCEVWTDMGNRLGKISDHLFDLKTGQVKQYLFVSGGIKGFAGAVYALYPSQILSWGSRRVMVSAAIVEDLEVYQAGVQEKFSKLTDMLREEKGHARQNFQSIVDRAKNKAQTLADQAREQAQILGSDWEEVAGQVRGKVRDLRDELRDGEFWDEFEVDRRRGDQRYADRDARDDYRDLPEDDFDFDEPWEAPTQRQSPPPEPPRPRQPLDLEARPRRRNAPPEDQDPWEDW